MTVTTEQAFEQLSADIHRFIRRRVDSDAVADDLLQDVFLRVHERLETLDDHERLAAWVFRIARNRIADHHRRGARREPIPIDDPADPEDTPERIVASWLEPMIETLEPKYRDALRLSELEGRTQQEVADQLGLSLSGAKSRVQRGRAQLQAKLLRCCHIEVDRRGGVVDWAPRRDCCDT